MERFCACWFNSRTTVLHIISLKYHHSTSNDKSRQHWSKRIGIIGWWWGFRTTGGRRVTAAAAATSSAVRTAIGIWRRGTIGGNIIYVIHVIICWGLLVCGTSVERKKSELVKQRKREWSKQVIEKLRAWKSRLWYSHWGMTHRRRRRLTCKPE